MERAQSQMLHTPCADEALGTRNTRQRLLDAILDRSERGCAWHGAPDGTIYAAFTLGACFQVMALFMLAPRATPHSAPALAQIAIAFAMLSIAPVIEEFLFRGVLFATLRGTLNTLGAAVVSTAACVALHAALYAMPALLVVAPPAPAAMPGALLLVGVLGAAAMALRLRHRALAPAIALNLGATFVALFFCALG